MAEEPITRPRKPKKVKPKPPRENHFVGVPVSRKVVAAMAAATGVPQSAVVQAIAKRITPELVREVHKELTEQTRLMADQQLEETLRAIASGAPISREQPGTDVRLE